MSGRLDSWDKVEAFALTQPGTELGKWYGMPAVKIAANGRSFVWTSGEPETSFAIWLEPDWAQMLLETDPDSFWQSPHYAGSSAVLVRYASDDPERVRHVIEQAFDLAKSMKRVRSRKKK